MIATSTQSSPEKTPISKMAFNFLWLVFALFSGLIVLDAIRFHEIADNKYQTPWYDNSWFKEPYTAFRLALLHKHEYWKPNAIGSELWHIREVQYGHVTFWTVLERKDLDRPN